MTMSLEEFRASLFHADVRSVLGLELSDAEAQQVAADPASTQNWYQYWLASHPAPMQSPPPPASSVAPPPPYQGTPAAPQHPEPAAPAAQPTAANPGATAAYAVPLAPDFQPTEVLPGPTGAPLDPQQGYAAGAAYPGTDPQYGAAVGYAGQPGSPDAGPQKKKRVGLWVALSVVGGLLLIAAVVVVAAFATARHWTKVDVPEQPETFYTEEYETGRYDVAMDTVNPCTVNQDWTDCTNLMVATYNAACLDVELTESATLLCTDYSGAIEQMKALDGDGYYVATLGTYGSLSRTPEMSTREVSNDDYKPAKTHEAVCYFEIIGECS